MSGEQTLFYRRVSQARRFLVGEGLLERPPRGSFRITERGRRVLHEGPTEVTRELLEQLGTSEPGGTGMSAEAFELAYGTLRRVLAGDVLEAASKASLELFERLVVELLVRMGYGGSQEDAYRPIGGSGGEGVEGIIRQDRLGFDTIYVQAERRENAVGRPEVEKFAAALQSQRARNGVLITTSTFTDGARDYATSIEAKVILIDGSWLAELMIEHRVGVTAS